MSEELDQEFEAYRTDEEALEETIESFNIDEFLLEEFDKIDKTYQQLEFKYHGLKAKREAKYGT